MTFFGIRILITPEVSSNSFYNLVPLSSLVTYHTVVKIERSITSKSKKLSELSIGAGLRYLIDRLIDLFIVLNATFSNISWRPVLVVAEAGVPGENHLPWASNWQTLSLAAASRVHPFL